MNVVWVGPFGFAPKGTVSRRMLPLAQALAKGSPCQVTVVVPPWDHPQDAGRVWTTQGVRVVNVALRGGGMGIMGALLREIAVRQPAVVHCFKPKGYSGLVLWMLWQARQAGLWRGRLVIDTDDWETGWNDRLTYAAGLPTLFAWQETWCLRHADGVTAASRWLEDLAVGLRGSARQVRRIPNGLDTTHLYPLASRPAGHPPTVVLYTRFVEVTPLRVQRTWRRVRQLLPHARLVVAGDSQPAGLAARLATMVGPADGVQCLGWVPAQAVPGVLAAADVAWVPSATSLVARARSSAKLVELMQAGLPVVADASGEVMTYVRHGIEGLLVTAGDDDDTARTLAGLLADAPRVTTYGRAAQARVRTGFSWDRLGQQVAAFYQELAP